MQICDALQTNTRYVYKKFYFTCCGAVFSAVAGKIKYKHFSSTFSPLYIHYYYYYIYDEYKASKSYASGAAATHESKQKCVRT